MAKSESTKIEFGYFHDYESEQFAFYRIPKVLFTDEYFRNLSSDAKVLYGLMLDRMALSIRHQWFDEEGKVYIIFTVEQVIQYMNCGRDKAMKTLAELDTKKGIGLIERVKQGFGKPDIIYVKNFILRTSKDVKNNDESEESIQQNREVEEVDLSESEKSTYRGRKNRLQGVGKTDFKRSENTTYRGRKIRTTEVGKIDPINTKYNYTDISNTDRNNTDLINLSDSSEQQSMDLMEEMELFQMNTALVKRNIEYDCLVQRCRLGEQQQLAERQVKSNIYAEMGKRLNFRSARSDRDRKNMEVAAKRWIKKKHPTFDGDVYVENIRCFLDISQEELEKRKCTVNEQDTTALIFSQKHLEALYLQCLMHRRNAMQEIPELKGLSETCNRIYKLQDVDVLFQCLLMDQMDWEEEKLYVQFSTIYLLKQTVKN